MYSFVRCALAAAFVISTASAELQNVQVGDEIRIRQNYYTESGASARPANQTDVAVTVYNNNLALVRDTREFHQLGTGELAFPFEGVAALVRPETVSLKSVSSPGSIRILEQNYEYDLISPSKLMEKYVGKKVKLQNFDSKIASGTVDAELLSVNEGPVYRAGSEIFIGHPGNVVLPELPGDLRARPTLVWQLQNDAPDQKVEVSYLTGGISWSADYVLTLAKDEKSLGVEGWVTLGNQSGAAYENAQLKLVAGEVNIVQDSAISGPEGGVLIDIAVGGKVRMRQETFGEYHLYTLPRRTTIKENQTKQVSLLSADSISAAKEYEYRGNASFYSQPIAPITEEKVGVFLVFQNEEANRLGIPLPAGVMRVYQEDESGALQFSGEDRIEHTPKDEEVRLRLGEAFDIVGERTQTDFHVIADQVFESSYEIKVRNHKAADIVVDVVEPMDGDWAVLTKSHDFVKKDARTAVFSLPAPRDGEAVLTYTVRVSHGAPIGIPLPIAAPRRAVKPLISNR